MSVKNYLVVVSLVITSVGLIGCGKSADTNAAPQTQVSGKEDTWWCSEHGVPEEICAQCNPKLAAEFKAKGDWCKEHHRPESQCFICHPELEAKFAAQYEAKYGKQPPKPKLQ